MIWSSTSAEVRLKSKPHLNPIQPPIKRE